MSIIGVVWYHTWYGTPQSDWLKHLPVLRSGDFGVEVFFTISGFLITTLLLRERDKRHSISLRDFYIRRSLRIWPLYYAVLGLYVVLVALTEHDIERKRVFFECLPSYLTYTYTWFGPWSMGRAGAIFNFAWSLSTEEQFYVFWPLMMRFFRRPWPVVAMIAVIAVRGVAQFGGLDPIFPSPSLAHRIIMSIAAPICAGAVLAHALHWRIGFQKLYAIVGRKPAAPVALILLGVSIIWVASNAVVLTWIMLPVFLGACVVREDNGLARVLRWRPLAFIGVISYGMYLFNTLVVKVLHVALDRVGIHHPLVAFPFILGLTVLVAWLSYRYFESPFLKLKQRFSRLKPPPVGAQVAFAGAESSGQAH